MTNRMVRGVTEANTDRVPDEDVTCIDTGWIVLTGLEAPLMVRVDLVATEPTSNRMIAARSSRRMVASTSMIQVHSTPVRSLGQEKRNIFNKKCSGRSPSSVNSYVPARSRDEAH